MLEVPVHESPASNPSSPSPAHMKLLFKAYRCSARALLAMFLAELVGPTVTSPCSPTAACFCLANSNREREGEEKWRRTPQGTDFTSRGGEQKESRGGDRNRERLHE